MHKHHHFIMLSFVFSLRIEGLIYNCTVLLLSSSSLRCHAEYLHIDDIHNRLKNRT